MICGSFRAFRSQHPFLRGVDFFQHGFNHSTRSQHELSIPGPVTIPEDILDVIDHQMIDHRGPQFASIQERVIKNLKTSFQTKNDLLLFTASGTGGLESAVVNTISPGDEVLAFVGGEFGERIAKLANTYGANVTKIKFENGQGIDPDRVAQELKRRAENQSGIGDPQRNFNGHHAPAQGNFESSRARTRTPCLLWTV